jgi:hypothetical protein
LYELLRQADEVYAADIFDAIEDARTELRDAENRLDAWLSARPDFSKNAPEAATRRLSPLQSQSLFPYVLAGEFIKKQSNLQHIKEKIHVLERRQRVITRYKKKKKKLREEVDTAVLAQENQIFHLNETFRAFTEGRNNVPADYFRKKFREYVAANRDKIENLSREMTEALLGGEFLEFQKRLAAFVEINILPAPQFSESIATVLQELTGGEEISDALGEWVSQHLHFSVRLKTGYAKLYTEANLFMPEAKTAFEVKKQYEARGLGRMNLFISDGSGNLAVLYHAGAFALEELFG